MNKILIKHVLHSLPSYLLDPPKSVIHTLNKIFSDFIWNDKDGNKKFHWEKWCSLSFPKNEGRIGLRRIVDLALAYTVKLWWRFSQKNTLWASFLNAKYCSLAHPAMMKTRRGSSSIWKSMIEA